MGELAKLVQHAAALLGEMMKAIGESRKAIARLAKQLRGATRGSSDVGGSWTKANQNPDNGYGPPTTPGSGGRVTGKRGIYSLG
jgi:hypothetical protein